MKNAFLTLILFTGIFSCKSQTQPEKEERIRAEIKEEFNKNISACNTIVNAVSDFNGQTEFWSVCDLKEGKRIFTIESYKNDKYYQEIYFEKNRDLIYAKETENYIPKNHFTQMAWNCEFYTKNGRLIALMSFGHGKTENDEWNPDVIFEMYKRRITELKQIKK